MFRADFIQFLQLPLLILSLKDVVIKLRLMSMSRFPTPHTHTVTLRDFRFASGQVLPELRLNVVTLGEKKTDTAGNVTGVALLLHNTTGTAENFLQPAARRARARHRRAGSVDLDPGVGGRS
jgi:hypothetical protein